MSQRDLRALLQRRSEINITVKGRTSGHSYTYPVWFVLEDDTLYLLPVRGTETGWYKNLRQAPTLEVRAGQQALTTNVRLIEDQSRVAAIAERFREKYGASQIQAYYPLINVAVEVPLSG
ncbi:MAG: nitroreductase family deazaflavin-dependent oxidoreductase [Thermogemmatispora sp.]|uniref:nitroreductase/quinone reductase family protein n=1 Tax=Thermogemmatispora sp. TaxID=1968838 RepID=UPI002636AC67|nr:nitroreductase/quinone reductase family protein [Thermogemmatispora sp.]MBX5458856.1 nitroreductase family deazaflavin-dependent oxidoreductase [Thermogemmatispora sp.]